MSISTLELDEKLSVLRKHKVFRYSENGMNIELFPEEEPLILNEKKPERLDEIDLMNERMKKQFNIGKEF